MFLTYHLPYHAQLCSALLQCNMFAAVSRVLLPACVLCPPCAAVSYVLRASTSIVAIAHCKHVHRSPVHQKHQDRLYRAWQIPPAVPLSLRTCLVVTQQQLDGNHHSYAYCRLAQQPTSRLWLTPCVAALAALSSHAGRHRRALPDKRARRKPGWLDGTIDPKTAAQIAIQHTTGAEVGLPTCTGYIPVLTVL